MESGRAGRWDWRVLIHTNLKPRRSHRNPSNMMANNPFLPHHGVPHPALSSVRECYLLVTFRSLLSTYVTTDLLTSEIKAYTTISSQVVLPRPYWWPVMARFNSWLVADQG